MLKGHWRKILDALNHLGKANADTISIYTGLKDTQVSRRMSELERGDWVYKPGTTSKTSSNHDANDYQLTQKAKDELAKSKPLEDDKLIEPILPVFAKPILMFRDEDNS